MKIVYYLHHNLYSYNYFHIGIIYSQKILAFYRLRLCLFRFRLYMKNNYHFDEEIKDDDVLFNYLIKPGKATSKNAIRLLSIMGFSEDIIDRAKLMADDFTQNGVWRT